MDDSRDGIITHTHTHGLRLLNRHEWKRATNPNTFVSERTKRKWCGMKRHRSKPHENIPILDSSSLCSGSSLAWLSVVRYYYRYPRKFFSTLRHVFFNSNLKLIVVYANQYIVSLPNCVHIASAVHSKKYSLNFKQVISLVVSTCSCWWYMSIILIFHMRYADFFLNCCGISTLVSVDIQVLRSYNRIIPIHLL